MNSLGVHGRSLAVGGVCRSLPLCLGLSGGVPGTLGTGRGYESQGLLTPPAGGALDAGAADFALSPLLLPQFGPWYLVIMHKSQLQ